MGNSTATPIQCTVVSTEGVALSNSKSPVTYGDLFEKTRDYTSRRVVLIHSKDKNDRRLVPFPDHYKIPEGIKSNKDYVITCTMVNCLNEKEKQLAKEYHDAEAVINELRRVEGDRYLFVHPDYPLAGKVQIEGLKKNEKTGEVRCVGDHKLVKVVAPSTTASRYCDCCGRVENGLEKVVYQCQLTYCQTFIDPKHANLHICVDCVRLKQL